MQSLFLIKPASFCIMLLRNVKDITGSPGYWYLYRMLILKHFKEESFKKWFLAWLAKKFTQYKM